MKKKIISLMMVMCLISLLSAGCSKKEKNKDNLTDENVVSVQNGKEVKKPKKDYADVRYFLNGNSGTKYAVKPDEEIKIHVGNTLGFAADIKTKYADLISENEQVTVEFTSDEGVINEEIQSIYFEKAGSFVIPVTYSINGENENTVEVKVFVEDTVLGNNPLNMFNNNRLLKTSKGEVFIVDPEDYDDVFVGTLDDYFKTGTRVDTIFTYDFQQESGIDDIAGLNEYNGDIYFSSDFSIYKLSPDYKTAELITTNKDGIIRYFTIINGEIYYYICTSSVSGRGYFYRASLDGKIIKKSQELYDVRYVTYKDGCIVFGGHGENNNFGIYRMPISLEYMEWIPDMTWKGKYAYCNDKVYSMNSMGLMEYEKGNAKEYNIIHDDEIVDILSVNNKLYFMSRYKNRDTLYEYDPVTQQKQVLRYSFGDGVLRNVNAIDIVDDVIIAYIPGEHIELYNLTTKEYRTTW